MLDHSGFARYADAFHLPFSHGEYGNRLTDLMTKPQLREHQRKVLRDDNIAQKSTFPDVLARFRDLAATDPRDKIYGLLGLASDTLGI